MIYNNGNTNNYRLLDTMSNLFVWCYSNSKDIVLNEIILKIENGLVKTPYISSYDTFELPLCEDLSLELEEYIQKHPEILI